MPIPHFRSFGLFAGDGNELDEIVVVENDSFAGGGAAGVVAVWTVGAAKLYLLERWMLFFL